MSVGSPTAGTWSSSQWRPDNEFETDTTFELGVDAQRRERPVQGGTDHGALGRATLRW